MSAFVSGIRFLVRAVLRSRAASSPYEPDSEEARSTERSKSGVSRFGVTGAEE